jgi:hypothetical protein
MKDRTWFIVFLVLLLTTGNINAQSTLKQTDQRRFEGLWTNKKTSRCLEISFEYGYATILDWTPKFQKRESGDIYKASLKNGKLIMPEETDHHAPYSEIRLEDNKLIYLTKQMGKGKISTFDKIVFTRSVNR